MREGDWVLARKSNQYYLAYIDFFSRDSQTVYVTRVARTVEGILLRLAHTQAICEIGDVEPLEITLPEEDRACMRDLMVDLALLTKDEKWFTELMQAGEQYAAADDFRSGAYQ